MHVDRRMNLVIPVYADDGKTIRAHVHAVPLSEEWIDRYYDILGKVFNKIFTGGLGIAAGPGHAMRVLRDLAKRDGTWEDDSKTGESGVRSGLVEEIRRTATIIKAGEGPVPLAIAADRGMIDAEDKAEVENAIVFFIAVSSTMHKSQRLPLLEGYAELWDARISPLNSTEFASSSKTSKPGASTGATESPAAADAPTAHPAAPAPGRARTSSVPY